MHLNDFSLGYFGSNGIVGASLGIAMGAALAAKLRHSGQVCVGFFGEGGENTGRTWEAVNFAASQKLPLIAICENNQYAVETYIGRALTWTLDRGAGVRLRTAGGPGRRPGCLCRLPRHRAGARAGGERRRSQLHRGGHLSLPRSQHRRGRRLPHRRRGRGVAAHARPDRRSAPRDGGRRVAGRRPLRRDGRGRHARWSRSRSRSRRTRRCPIRRPPQAACSAFPSTREAPNERARHRRPGVSAGAHRGDGA